MDKRKMHSPDLTQRNIDRIAELFPTAVTETLDGDGNPARTVDFDALRQELSDHVVEGPQERYQLDWPGKRAAAFAANAPIAKTLRPVRGESVDFDTTKNLFIEGDNLDALKLLQESYLGKVKLIYIDPPYNTGNDFVYDDDFAESSADYLARSGQTSATGDRLIANTEANGRFHSDWLSMMYPRLKLAKNLLAPEGLMFISADDSEASALVQIAGEVFGRNNVVATIAWEKRYTRSNNANSFYSVKDTIVLCRRSEAAGRIKELRSDAAAGIYSNPDNDPRGSWTSASYVNPATQAARPKLVYSITRPEDGVAIDHPTHAWKFQRSENERHAAEGRLWWGRDGLARYPRLKVFLSEMDDGMVPIDLWSHELAGTTDEGGKEVKDLFQGNSVFDFPKPTKLIRKLLGIFVPPSQEWSKDMIVLDFFAGSSSTAHAVLAQNAADGGSRRFVMVQLSEETPSASVARAEGYSDIAQISRERIRRAAAAIKPTVAKVSDGHTDIQDFGFRTLRVDTTSMADTSKTADALQQGELTALIDSVKPDRTDEDLLFQVLLDWGLDLSLPIKRSDVEGHAVFSVAEDALVVCFENHVSPAVVKSLAAVHPLRAVFKDSAFADDERTNAEQIFREVSPDTEIRTI
ncbi:site-specific DNA-methyltransferase [Brachybacterium tyrofermentans]|uniref:site-specific DNA-methyltransferase n=1 Tax=Brachybacterium tyrofermentans TaxID=47848 RepID=UPI003FD30B29